MINEFYAALLNQQAGNVAVGSDFVPSQWQPQQLDENIASLRTTVLGDPTRAETCNWRAMEIRRLIRRSDLQSFFDRFDQRTGYQEHQLLRSMVGMLQPHVAGSIMVEPLGAYRAKHFQLSTWTLSVSGTTLTVAHGDTEVAADISAGAVLVDLPGAMVKAKITGTDGSSATLRWAANPQITIADSAAMIRKNQLGYGRQAISMPSVFESDELELLAKIMTSKENAATVGAAALIVAGHILKRYKDDNPSNPVRVSS